MKTRHAAITLGLVLGAASLVLGDGTIDTTNATLAIGDAPATGTVTIDPGAPRSRAPSLPQMPPLQDLGTFTGAMPALPALGDGSDGAFVVDSSTTRSGGTYSYTTFTVEAGVSLEYKDPVTILCTGDATINGTVFTDTAGASITIVCGGTLTLGSGASIDARATGSALVLEAGDNILGGRVVDMEGAAGLTLRAHGLDGDSRKINLTEGGSLTQGDLLLQSNLAINFQDVVVNAHGDSFLAQSFENVVTLRGVALTKSTDGDVVLEGSLGVTVSGDSDFRHQGTGPIRMRAFAGSISFLESDVRVTSGPLDCLAATAVSVIGSVLEALAGPLTLQGDQILVSLLPLGGNHLAATGADLTLRSATTIAIVGSTQMVATNGDLILHARSDQMLMVPDAQSLASPRFFAEGAEFRSGTMLTARIDRVVVNTVDFSAGTGGVGLDIDQFVSASGGPLNVLSEGAIRLNGAFNSQDGLTVMSRGGDIDLASGPASLQTHNADDSANIRVESFAPTGTISAANATLRTGTGTATSGDISLIVHGAPPSAIQATRVVVAPARGRRPPTFTLRAVLDTGTSTAADGLDLAGGTTIRVGGHMIDLPSLDAHRNGRRFIYRDQATMLTITRARGDSSKATLALVIREDLTDLVDPNGETTISLTGSGYGASTTVQLASGRFRLGRVPGTLIDPTVYLERATIRLRGGGRDTCRATIGYAAPADVPGGPVDVTLTLTDALAATITADQFKKRGARFRFASRDGPIRSMVVDPLRGRVIVNARNLDFGDEPDGPMELPFTLDVGGMTGSGAVIGTRTARTLRY